MAERLQLIAQTGEIVDFTVVDDHQAGPAHGLGSGAAQVDDGEPGVAQGAAVVIPAAPVVGSARVKALDRALQPGADLPPVQSAEIDYAG